MEMIWIGIVAQLLVSNARGMNFSSGTTVEDIMNTCLDGQNHKSKPGPESNLFGHCSPWASWSCCTNETSGGIAFERVWLNFNWHHCTNLSARCTDHFKKDLCFYECTPNGGPYLVSDVRKIRNQRYQNVPLCQKTCNDWWEACKSDLTCTDNWIQNFNWSTGSNQCPTGSRCDTFLNIFGSAKTFCEGVWDHSFKVVPDTEDCFVLWFSSDMNPNDAVARRAAQRLLAVSTSPDRLRPICLAVILVVLSALFFPSLML